MSKKYFALAVTTTLLSAPIYAAHWNYENGGEGPANWGKLDPANVSCAIGKTQTPVDIKEEVRAKLESIKFKYITNATEIFNNGHTIQTTIAPGSSITVDGIEFQLKQVHFHTPSENFVHGKPFSMEAHFVHADKDGNFAVVGLMMQEGKENAALAPLWKQMPVEANPDKKIPLDAKVNPASLLPISQHYYRFDGSLTTPPCSEGVRWLVLKTPVSVSKGQIEQFAKVVHEHNARPLQPLGARLIMTND